MVFLGLLVPSKKAPENSPKPKNGKASYHPSGHPNKSTFHTIVSIAVLNVSDSETRGTAHQIEVLKDAGHVVHLKPGEVEQLLDINVPLDESVHLQQEVLLPLHDVQLGEQLTPGRDIQLFKAVERPSRRFLAANQLDFFTVSKVKQELISPKLNNKVGCGNGDPWTVGRDNLLIPVVKPKDTISFNSLIQYIIIWTKICAA
jgi:hypothetical protein